MKKRMIGAAAAALLAGSAAIAQSGTRAPARGDAAKVQTRAEVQTRVAEHFARVDANRDGFITQAEAQTLRTKAADKRGGRQGAGGRTSRWFDRVDTDRNGVVTRAESDAVKAMRAARRSDQAGRAGELAVSVFQRLDSDRDGQVTRAEFDTANAQRLAQRQGRQSADTRKGQRADPAQRFAQLDSNRDGQVTRAEFDAQIAARMQRRTAPGNAAAAGRPGERLFARLDADKNGAISLAEFQVKGQRADRRAARGHRGGRFGAQMFTAADVNRDQRVSLQEATAVALEHFDRADANRDGQLTREERRQAMQQLRSAGTQKPR